MSEWLVKREDQDDGSVRLDAYQEGVFGGGAQQVIDFKPGQYAVHSVRRAGLSLLAQNILQADPEAKIGDCEDYGLDGYVRLGQASAAVIALMKEREAA